MLRWMLRVDNWLDVAPLENVEEDHSFLFLKKNLMKIFVFFFFVFFFFLFFDFGKLEFFEGIENFDWWIFFFFWKQPKKYEPNASSPKALFENFSFFFFSFFFLKILVFCFCFERFRENWFFFLNFFFLEIWRFVHYQKVKKMKMKTE